ncbi:agamous-like MADS-box protein AGL62 [Brassica napus]|uniref:agamous-like MADS-box protein AGL62 n=1 Tax=Brassica napus TaxID=3708 RepID=UPI00207887E4|nr:agamous-like MADS-box protein AGL62 [Brassica napus]
MIFSYKYTKSSSYKHHPIFYFSSYQYRETMRKTKGRLKTKMVKIEKEKNLQVTFCKRKNGLFKKANELCTLCNARVAIILFSPSGKIFSFGHTKVETIIDRFKKTDHPDSNTQSNMQLGEIHQNSAIRGLNNRLTEVMKNVESEQKTNEELKKLRKKSKLPEIWLKESIGGLDLGQAKEFKGKLENLKKQVIYEAFKSFQATPFPQPGFYGGSSSNAPFGVDGNVNAFDNHNMVLSNHPSPFVPGFNHNMALPSHPNPNESGNEHPHDGHPPQPRSD